MKKPNTTVITESIATRHLHDFLRLRNISQFKNEELEASILKYYAEQLKEIDGIKDNRKYYKYIYGHAKKILKRDGLLKEEQKTFYVIKREKNPSVKEKTEQYKWETDLTIKNVFSFIDNKSYVLPSFQRGTAWTSQKDYKELALSIYMQIPMGVMYFWEINERVAKEVGHYSFKRDIKPQDSLNFKKLNINEYKEGSLFSIIDGQQRITGVNVIVNGTFNDKKLYFNEEKYGVEMFSFKNSSDNKWKSIHEIYNELNSIRDDVDMDDQIEEISRKLDITVFSLNMFYQGFFESNLISVCTFKGGDLLRILEVFIRVNNFGKKLKPSDLMLSALVGNNENKEFDIRKETNDLWDMFKDYKRNYSFASVLKLLSIYFTNDSKINHRTFESRNAELHKDFSWSVKGWRKLKKSVRYTIEVLKEMEIKGNDLKSDNSLIPIIYWHSRNHKSKIVNDNQKNNINTYIIFVHLFKHFGSSTDTKLLDLIKQVENDENFNNWKIFTEKKKINKELIINEIRDWDYSTDQKKIKTILSLNENTLDGSDSIEHLDPQSKNGSDKLFNLALIPHQINSYINDNDIDEKINMLVEKYAKTKEEIESALIIESSNEKRIETIAEMIINKIA